MVLAAKSSSSSSTKEGNWGRGFLLVFFHHPEEEYPPDYKRKPSFSLSSPLKSAINNHNPLLSKTQSTLSICALLLFTTLLFFTISTFEPTTTSAAVHHHINHRSNRRVLRQNDENTLPRFSISPFFGTKLEPALQGMGMLYRRGSKAMTDLVVGHVAEGATEREITTFMRLIHHSGLLSRSDLVFIFYSPDSVSRLGRVVKSESESFLRLVNMSVLSRGSVSGLTRYLRPVGEEDKESLWGKKGNWNLNLTHWGELTRASYGSVVGFDSSELDPEDSLSGFLDRVPMGLRRWACYPMLLGRVRRNYKHTMLIDVRNSLVLSDPFSPIRNRTAESVVVWSNSDTESTRSHGRRNLGVGGVHLNSGVIIGGARGIRRFANAALTEIVRSVVGHKGKARNSVTESGLVNQLVHSGHLLKNIKMITSTESIPDASLLAGFNSLGSAGSGLLAFADYFSVVQRGHGRVSIDIDSVVKSEICSSHELYSSVYRDCLASQ